MASVSVGCNGSSDDNRYCLFASFYARIYTEEVRLLLVTSHTNSLRRVAHSPFLSHLLRAQRAWKSRPSKSPSVERHLYGCAGDHIFGERTRDCLV